jgi:hypothetical protein
MGAREYKNNSGLVKWTYPCIIREVTLGITGPRARGVLIDALICYLDVGLSLLA